MKRFIFSAILTAATSFTANAALITQTVGNDYLNTSSYVYGKDNKHSATTSATSTIGFQAFDQSLGQLNNVYLTVSGNMSARAYGSDFYGTTNYGRFNAQGHSHSTFAFDFDNDGRTERTVSEWTDFYQTFNWHSGHRHYHTSDQSSSRRENVAKSKNINFSLNVSHLINTGFFDTDFSSLLRVNSSAATDYGRNSPMDMRAYGRTTLGTNALTFKLTYDYTEVPEPSTLAIFALGLAGLASRKFKK